MCDCRSRTVRLDFSGRYFTCAYCRCVKRHPCLDLFYHIDGYAFCDFCSLWMKIENPEAQPSGTEDSDARAPAPGSSDAN